VSADEKTDTFEAETRALLIKLSGYRKPIENATSINLDIRIDGNDAYELVKSIQKRFGTDFSTFDWSRYFNDEPNALWFHWKTKLGFKDQRKSLTFSRLIEAIRKGEWSEE
jgi:hypothetical protein